MAEQGRLPWQAEHHCNSKSMVILPSLRLTLLHLFGNCCTVSEHIIFVAKLKAYFFIKIFYYANLT